MRSSTPDPDCLDSCVSIHRNPIPEPVGRQGAGICNQSRCKSPAARQENPASLSLIRQNQEELAQTIAGQIATTIENANLFEQAVRRAERERQVTEITAKIRSSNDPNEIMETAIAELKMALTKTSGKIKKTTRKHPPHPGNKLPGNGNENAQN